MTNRTESEQEYGRSLLTPAEVNQLSQDDGILLVGGLLPYRARKVRYFLDPRFKGRDGLPTPDSPEEQGRELLGGTPSDWDGLVVGASAPVAAGAEGGTSSVKASTRRPPEAAACPPIGAAVDEVADTAAKVLEPADTLKDAKADGNERADDEELPL